MRATCIYKWMPGPFTVLLICYTQLVQGLSESHTVQENGITYVLYSDLLLRNEAEYACAKKGGNLVKITDDLLPKDRETPFSKMAGLIQSGHCIWVGLTDRYTDGDWQWFDGSSANDVEWDMEVLHYMFQYEWDCGKICQENSAETPEAWSWKQVSCIGWGSADQANFICQFGCPNCTDESDRNSVTHNGTMYQHKDELRSYPDADGYCRKHGGFLAKLSGDIVKGNTITSLCSVIKNRIGESFWIGMDKLISGTFWMWFDGTEVTVGGFEREKQSFFDRFTGQGKKRCGRILYKGQCSTNSGNWEWSRHRCDEKAPFMCQFKEPKPKPRRPARHNPGTIRRREEVRRQHVDFRVTTGAPVLDQRTLSPTMCARLCKGKCDFFNYHAQTRHCLGYANVKYLEGRYDPGWDVWNFFYV